MDKENILLFALHFQLIEIRILGRHHVKVAGKLESYKQALK